MCDTSGTEEVIAAIKFAPYGDTLEANCALGLSFVVASLHFELYYIR